MVNGTTHKVATTIADADFPRDVAVSPLTGDVYVVNQGISFNGSVHPDGVWVINWRTSKVTATIAVPKGDIPAGVAVSPRTGDVYVSVINYSLDTGGVLVVSGRTNKVTAIINDKHFPAEMAVSPRTGDVYVVNWGSALVPATATACQLSAARPTRSSTPSGIPLRLEGSRSAR